MLADKSYSMHSLTLGSKPIQFSYNPSVPGFLDRVLFLTDELPVLSWCRKSTTLPACQVFLSSSSATVCLANWSPLQNFVHWWPHKTPQRVQELQTWKDKFNNRENSIPVRLGFRRRISRVDCQSLSPAQKCHMIFSKAVFVILIRVISSDMISKPILWLDKRQKSYCIKITAEMWSACFFKWFFGGKPL